MTCARQLISLMGCWSLAWGGMAVAETGDWRDLFNGSDLQGWHGDPTYWRVEAGVLVGEVTPDTLLSRNSWLIYEREEFSDFELWVEFRVSSEGNSGVGYRLQPLEGRRHAARGPQADIDGAGQWMGSCYEENGRRFLALRGTTTEIAPGAMPTLIRRWTSEDELLEAVRDDDWNTYRILVQGNYLRHELNGTLMSEVIDHDRIYGQRSGRIGVQVHIGPPMTIEFRRIRIRPMVGPFAEPLLSVTPPETPLPLEAFTNPSTLQHLRGAEPRH